MSDTNKDIVLNFLAASVRGDKEAMIAMLHPDVRVIEADSLPYGGISQGPQAFIDLISKVFKTWDDTSVTIDHMLCEGDRVVSLAHMTGQGKHGGRKFNMPIAEVWLIDSGKIKEVRPFYFDTKTLHDIEQESRP